MKSRQREELKLQQKQSNAKPTLAIDKKYLEALTRGGCPSIFYFCWRFETNPDFFPFMSNSVIPDVLTILLAILSIVFLMDHPYSMNDTLQKMQP